MKLKDLFKDKETAIFRVVNDESGNELKMEIEPTDLKTIPDGDGYFIVRAIEVKGNKIGECFIDMNTPERISEIIIKKGFLGNIKITGTHTTRAIPTVASDCFGLYELYYSKDNPEIGIRVLKDGLQFATNKNIVAEDLGYILRDENRITEAIEAFHISENHGPSTPYTFLELAYLYEQLGDDENGTLYHQKFIENGGKIISIF